MRRRRSKRFIRFLAGFLILAVIAAGGLLWRLSVAPVQVSFLLPYLQQALVDPASGYELDINSAAVAWDREDHSLVIRTGGSSLREAGGRRVLEIPSTKIRLDVTALLSGRVQPSRIDVVGIETALRIGLDGRVHAGADTSVVPDESVDLPDTAFDPWRLVQTVLSPGNDTSLFRVLEAVTLHHARVTLTREKTGREWLLKIPRLQVQRLQDRLGGIMTASVATDGLSEELNLDVNATLSEDAGRVDIAFDNVNPSEFPEFEKSNNPLYAVAIPIEGQASFLLARASALQTYTFRLKGQRPGEIREPLVPKPLPLRSVSAEGRVDLAAGIVEIDRAELAADLSADGQTKAVVEGAVHLRDESQEIKGNVTVENVSVTDIKTYWPAGDPSDLRAWIGQDLRQGTVTAGQARFHAVVADGAITQNSVRTVEASLRFRNAAVQIAPGVPAVKAPAGEVSVGKDTAVVSVPAATLASLTFSDTEVRISGLRNASLRAELSTEFFGGVRETLAVVERLGGPGTAALPFDVSRSSGRLTSSLSMSFPLGKAVSLQTARLSATGSVADASVPEALLGQDVRNADLDFGFDGKLLQLSGALTFADAPMVVDIKQAMTPGGLNGTRFEASLPQIDAAYWSAFGLDLTAYLQGPHAVTVAGRVDGRRTVVMDAVVDVRSARIDLPAIQWRKQAGQAGRIAGRVTIGPDDQIILENATVEAGGLRAAGRMKTALKPGSAIDVAVTEVILGKSHLKDLTVRVKGQVADIAVGKGTVDASAYLGSVSGKGETARSDADRTPPVPTFTSVKLRAPKLDRVYLADDTYLIAVSLEFDYRDEVWQEANISASASADAGLVPVLDLRFAPLANGDHFLVVRSSDFGRLLKATGLSEGISGGRMLVEGVRKRRPDDSPMYATLDVNTFHVKRTPILGQVLAVESLADIRGVFERDGIPFDRLFGTLVLEGGAISSDNLRAHGGSLAITAAGRVDLDADAVRIEGLVVPARRLNKLLAQIPVLGRVLTGSGREGLLAVKYAVDGKASDPQVSVNPGSVLAPGILRDLFGGIFD